jgi:hypothetical protein
MLNANQPKPLLVSIASIEHVAEQALTRAVESALKNIRKMKGGPSPIDTGPIPKQTTTRNDVANKATPVLEEETKRGTHGGGGGGGDVSTPAPKVADLPDMQQFSRGAALAAGALTAISVAAPGIVHAFGIRFSDIWKGAIKDEKTFQVNMREILWQTRGFTQMNREIEEEYININKEIIASGVNRTVFMQEWEKSVKRGIVLEGKEFKLEGSRDKLMAGAVARQRQLTKTALFTAQQLGISVDHMNQMFGDLQHNLGLSVNQIGIISDGMRQVASTSGVTGSELQKAMETASQIMKKMKGAGTLSEASAKNVLEMSAMMQKYGVGEKGAEMMQALSGPVAFQKAADEMKYLLMTAASMSGGKESDQMALKQKVQFGTVLGDKDAINKLGKGMEERFKTYFKHAGVTDDFIKKELGIAEGFNAKNMSTILQRLDEMGYGKKAYAIRTLSEQGGMDVGTGEQMSKMFAELQKTQTQRMKELATDIAKAEATGGGGLDDTVKKRRDLEQMEMTRALTSFSTLAEEMDKSGGVLNDQAKKAMESRLKGDYDNVGDEFLSKIQKNAEQTLALMKKSGGAKFTKALERTNWTEDQLLKGMTSGNKTAAAVLRQISEEIGVKKKSEIDPVTEMLEQVRDINAQLRAFTGPLLAVMNYKTLVGIILAGLAAGVAAKYLLGMSLIDFIRSFFGGGKFLGKAGKAAAGGIAAGGAVAAGAQMKGMTAAPGAARVGERLGGIAEKMNDIGKAVQRGGNRLATRIRLASEAFSDFVKSGKIRAAMRSFKDTIEWGAHNTRIAMLRTVKWARDGSNWRKVFIRVGDAIADAWESGNRLIGKGWRGVKRGFGAAREGIRGAGRAAWRGIATVGSRAIEGGAAALHYGIQGARALGRGETYAKAGRAMGRFGHAAWDTMRAAPGAISRGVKAAPGVIAEGVQGASKLAGRGIKGAGGLVEGVANFFKTSKVARAGVGAVEAGVGAAEGVAKGAKVASKVGSKIPLLNTVFAVIEGGIGAFDAFNKRGKIFAGVLGEGADATSKMTNTMAASAASAGFLVGALDSLTFGALSLTGAFQPLVKLFSYLFETVYQSAVKFATGFWDALKGVFASEAFQASLKSLGDAWEKFKGIFSGLFGGGDLGETFKKTWDTIYPAMQKAGEVVGWFSGKVLQGLIDTLTKVIEGVTSLVGGFFEGLKNIFQSKVFQTVIQGLASSWNYLVDSLSDAWNTLSQTFSDVWNTIFGGGEGASAVWEGVKTVLQTVGTVVGWLTGTIFEGLIVALSTTFRVVGFLANILATLVSWVIKAAMWIGQLVWSVLKPLVKTVIWVAETIWGILWPALKLLWFGLKTVGNIVSWLVTDVLVPLIKVVFRVGEVALWLVWQALWPVRKMFELVGSVIMWVGGVIYDWLIKPLWDFGKGVVKAVKGFIDGAVQKWNDFVDWFTSDRTLSEKFGDVMRACANAIWNALPQWAKDLISPTASAVDTTAIDAAKTKKQEASTKLAEAQKQLQTEVDPQKREALNKAIEEHTKQIQQATQEDKAARAKLTTSERMVVDSNEQMAFSQKIIDRQVQDVAKLDPAKKVAEAEHRLAFLSKKGNSVEYLEKSLKDAKAESGDGWFGRFSDDQLKYQETLKKQLDQAKGMRDQYQKLLDEAKADAQKKGVSAKDLDAARGSLAAQDVARLEKMKADFMSKGDTAAVLQDKLKSASGSDKTALQKQLEIRQRQESGFDQQIAAAQDAAKGLGVTPTQIDAAKAALAKAKTSAIPGTAGATSPDTKKAQDDLKKTGEMATEATKKGSIYTHDIHTEPLLKSIDETLIAIFTTLSEKIKAHTTAVRGTGAGAFAKGQSKEAMEAATEEKQKMDVSNSIWGLTKFLGEKLMNLPDVIRNAPEILRKMVTGGDIPKGGAQPGQAGAFAKGQSKEALEAQTQAQTYIAGGQKEVEKVLAKATNMGAFSTKEAREAMASEIDQMQTKNTFSDNKKLQETVDRIISGKQDLPPEKIAAIQRSYAEGQTKPLVSAAAKAAGAFEKAASKDATDPDVLIKSFQRYATEARPSIEESLSKLSSRTSEKQRTEAKTNSLDYREETSESGSRFVPSGGAIDVEKGTASALPIGRGDVQTSIEQRRALGTPGAAVSMMPSMDAIAETMAKMYGLQADKLDLMVKLLAQIEANTADEPEEGGYGVPGSTVVRSGPFSVPPEEGLGVKNIAMGSLTQDMWDTEPPGYAMSQVSTEQRIG